MPLVWIVWFVALLGIGPVAAAGWQCLDTTVVLESDEEVKQFFESCVTRGKGWKILDGTTWGDFSVVTKLILHGSGVTTLTGLNGLTKIEGHLIIDKTALKTFDGLSSLSSAHLTISNNTELRNILGLDSFIEGVLTIHNNAILAEIIVPQLNEVKGGDLIISNNRMLTLVNFSSLEEVGDYRIKISNCSRLPLRNIKMGALLPDASVELRNYTTKFLSGSTSSWSSSEFPEALEKITLDIDSWPQCMTDHELAVVNIWFRAKSESEDLPPGMTTFLSPPEIDTSKRWKEFGCGPAHVSCITSFACKIYLTPAWGAAYNATENISVAVSLEHDTCGVCSKELAWGNISDGVIDFGHSLELETIGDYSICICDGMPRPLVQLHIGDDEVRMIGEAFEFRNKGLLANSSTQHLRLTSMSNCSLANVPRDSAYSVASGNCSSMRDIIQCPFAAQQTSGWIFTGLIYPGAVLRVCRCESDDCDEGLQVGVVIFTILGKHMEYFAAFCIYILSLAIFVHFLIVSLFRGAGIEDISCEHGKCVIKTRGALFGHETMHFLQSFAVFFVGTGHPLLDGKTGYRARVIALNTLELLDSSGKPITTRVDTSQGRLSVDRLHEFLVSGFIFPFGIWIISLVPIISLSFSQLHHDFKVSMFTTIVALALGAPYATYRRAKPQVSKLEQYLEVFARNLPDAPIRSKRGPHRAITLHKVLQLYGFFKPLLGDRTAYYLDSNITRRLTKLSKVSYAELVGSTDVEWFVSHFWGNEVKHLTRSLAQHAKSVRGKHFHLASYWICFLSNCQFEIEEELGAGNYKESSFYLALRSETCKGTCMILDELVKPLTRVWCIFETAQTLRLQEEQPRFEGLLLCSSSGVLNYGKGSIDVALNLVRRIISLDLEEAEASDEGDKERIKRVVIEEFGSYSNMHKALHRQLRKVLESAEQHTKQEFAHIFSLLDETHEDHPTEMSMQLQRSEAVMRHREEIEASVQEHTSPHSRIRAARAAIQAIRKIKQRRDATRAAAAQAALDDDAAGALTVALAEVELQVHSHASRATTQW